MRPRLVYASLASLFVIALAFVAIQVSGAPVAAGPAAGPTLIAKDVAGATRPS